MSGNHTLRSITPRHRPAFRSLPTSPLRDLSHAGVALFLCLLGLPTAPAVADVLVMNDGSRIETKGPWQVEGRQVQFRLANGALSAVRLSEVDLERSRAATVATTAPETEPAEPEAPRTSVLTLTNESLGLGPDGVAPEAEDDSNAATPGAMPDGELKVGKWDYTPGTEPDEVYEVVGEIVNLGKFRATKVQVYMDIVAVDPTTRQPEPDRHLLRPATLDSREIEPGGSTGFRYAVKARDLLIFGDRGFDNPAVSFDIQFIREEVESPSDGTESVDQTPTSAVTPVAGEEG